MSVCVCVCVCTCECAHVCVRVCVCVCVRCPQTAVEEAGRGTTWEAVQVCLCACICVHVCKYMCVSRTVDAGATAHDGAESFDFVVAHPHRPCSKLHDATGTEQPLLAAHLELTQTSVSVGSHVPRR